MSEPLIDEQISTAVTLMRRLQAETDTVVFAAIVRTGTSRPLAARLVEFLPMAYCRIVFAGSGVQFANSYKRRSEPRLLSAEPEWLAISKYAQCEVERGVSPSALISIAGRSAEFQAVNESLKRGSELRDLILTEAIFSWPESGPEI